MLGVRVRVSDHSSLILTLSAILVILSHSCAWRDSGMVQLGSSNDSLCPWYLGKWVQYLQQLCAAAQTTWGGEDTDRLGTRPKARETAHQVGTFPQEFWRTKKETRQPSLKTINRNQHGRVYLLRKGSASSQCASGETESVSYK